MTERVNKVQQKGIKAVSRQLQEFGYPDATESYIQEAFQRWRDGDEPRDIIDQFAYRDFNDEEYRAIFGKGPAPKDQDSD